MEARTETRGPVGGWWPSPAEGTRQRLLPFASHALQQQRVEALAAAGRLVP